jgi:hypothetical protein
VEKLEEWSLHQSSCFNLTSALTLTSRQIYGGKIGISPFELSSGTRERSLNPIITKQCSSIISVELFKGSVRAVAAVQHFCSRIGTQELESASIFVPLTNCVVVEECLIENRDV